MINRVSQFVKSLNELEIDLYEAFKRNTCPGDYKNYNEEIFSEESISMINEENNNGKRLEVESMTEKKKEQESNEKNKLRNSDEKSKEETRKKHIAQGNRNKNQPTQDF